jgi:hypothetical protein
MQLQKTIMALGKSITVGRMVDCTNIKNNYDK